MQREAFQLTAEFEKDHWWFRSRRELFLLQVERATVELGLPPGELRILDYGCGTGFNLDFLGAYGVVCGADVPSAQGRGFRKPTGRPILDLCSDLAAHHRRFHVVTALDVLEHLADDVAGLRAISRFLAPRGQIVLTVPAYDWLWGGEDVLSEHERRYSKTQLVRVCRAAGFEPLFVSYFNLSILPALAAVVWRRRLFAPRGPAVSNLEPTGGRLNEWLYRLTSFEARRVGSERWRLPAGASLVCRCAARP